MWNEPGNVIGFPACALSAMQATPDSKLNARLTELAYSHMDNAFGRNPTGRHFSYDAPREIEGVELGWYSFHVGGYGQLDACPMTFDGSPKNKHYPYNPQVGDIGWSEGWVQHNTAFNLSLAYMAYQDTTIKVRKVGKQLKVYLKAPLNFDYKKVEKVTVNMKVNGKLKALKLTEEGESSAWFSATIPSPQTKASISYGYGYFQKTFSLPWLGH